MGSIDENRPIYLDFNATTPVDPRVAEVVMHYMCEEFGNAGSRTHEYGTRAKKAVETARGLVARKVNAVRNEVVFTSGATESNNLAILGLAAYGQEASRRHIITTAIEHKSVLEPCRRLEEEGFQVTYISPGVSGRIDANDVAKELRPDTLLVSVMHANNETGVIQPLEDIIDLLYKNDTFLHVDAAQTFCKLAGVLQSSRIDLISISGHKVFAPKGVGALVVRNNRSVRSKLKPLMFGGGQEQGLRPGTVPVPLVAGLGQACEIASDKVDEWFIYYAEKKELMLDTLKAVPFTVIGDQTHAMPNCVSVSFPGVDSDALFVSLSSRLSLSNGSACTSSSYGPSHVLKAMGLSNEIISTSIRVSWSDKTKVDSIRLLVDAVLVFS